MKNLKVDMGLFKKQRATLRKKIDILGQPKDLLGLENLLDDVYDALLDDEGAILEPQYPVGYTHKED